MKAGEGLNFRYTCLPYSAFMFLISLEGLFSFIFVFNLKTKETQKYIALGSSMLKGK